MQLPSTRQLYKRLEVPVLISSKFLFHDTLSLSPNILSFPYHRQIRFIGTEIKKELREAIWPIIHNQMIEYFRQRSVWNTALQLRAWDRPRSMTENLILEEGHIPCSIVEYGPTRNIVVQRKDIHPYAFDEEQGHLSFHFTNSMCGGNSHVTHCYRTDFKSRLFYLRFKDHIERVVVKKYTADTVERRLFNIQFARHVPGYPTSVDIPVCIVGLQGSRIFRRGFNTELAVPAVPCHILSEIIPPPFFLDMSRVKPKGNQVTTIYLESLKSQLPSDGSVIFSPEVNPSTFEVVWIYAHGTLPMKPRPDDWKDPNFVDRRGNVIQLSVSGEAPDSIGVVKNAKKHTRGEK